MPARPNTRRRPRPPGSTVRREPVSEDQRMLDAFVDSKAWRMLRQVYISTHPLCELCRAAGLAVAASHVHHKVSRAERRDLALDWANLQALCRPCHSRLTIDERRRRRNGPA